MQPRNNKNHLFSGAPLIRNGPQNGSAPCATAVVPVAQAGQPPTPAAPPPPGVICCFQPVYYVPMQHNPTIHPPPPQLALPPPPPTASQQQQSASTINSTQKKINNAQQQAHTPKRRNYKTLQISSNGNNKLPLTNTSSLSNVSSPTSPTMKTLIHSSQQPPLTPTAAVTTGNNIFNSRPSYSDSPGSDRNSSSSSPIENIYCNDTVIGGLGKADENELNFQSVIESSRFLVSTEEKQRSDKLLNFYFYDEHWRPREVQSSSSSSSLSSASSTSGDTNNNHYPAKFHYGNYESSNNYNNENMRSNIHGFDSQPQADWFNPSNSTPLHCQENEIEAECKKNFLNYYQSENGGNSCSMTTTTMGSAAVATTTAAATIRFSQAQGNGNDQVMLSRSMTPAAIGTTPANAPPSATTTATAMVIKKKDLEVEAQIVTLANGHRDLEIRLCYVTS